MSPLLQSFRAQALDETVQSDVSPHLPRYVVPPKASAFRSSHTTLESKIDACINHEIPPFQRDKQFGELAGQIVDGIEQKLGPDCTIEQISAGKNLKLVLDVLDHVVDEETP